MKILVRHSVFETNSSSVHTISIVTDDVFKGWENGEYVYNAFTETLIPIEEAKKDERWEHDKECKPYNKTFLTWDEYNDWDIIPYEMYTQSYTTKSGDKIVAFGYYGHD